jgi:hypothetical protein
MIRVVIMPLCLALMAIAGACGPVRQPGSLRYEAAIEVSLEKTSADRADLMAMLRRHAAADGLHVDDVSAEAQSPLGRTIYVGVWRGADDNDMEISVDDAGHAGRAWVVFSTGAQPERAARLRRLVSADILRRWPQARRVPVTPSGGLPLADDLRATNGAYEIEPAAAARYAEDAEKASR